MIFFYKSDPLSLTDETFYEICRPNIDFARHLTLEEDKVKIVWLPADIERWLQTGKRSSSTQRAIEIDSYEVTIFPAESVKNTHTLPALSKKVQILENGLTRTRAFNIYVRWCQLLTDGMTPTPSANMDTKLQLRIEG